MRVMRFIRFVGVMRFIRFVGFMRVAAVAAVARVGRLWLTACIRQAHVAVTSAVAAAQHRFQCCGSYRWICSLDLLGAACVQPVCPDPDLPHPRRMMSGQRCSRWRSAPRVNPSPR